MRVRGGAMVPPSKQDKISASCIGPLHESCKDSSDDVDVVLNRIDSEKRQSQDGG